MSNELIEIAYQKGRSDAINKIYSYVKRECNPYGKPTLDFESGKKILNYLEQLKEYITEYDRTIEIHTDGLEEGIRCALCTNPIKSDRGCDGGCRVDEDVRKKIMDVIDRCTVNDKEITANCMLLTDEQVKDIRTEAYQKGREDKYKEITSEYMLLTEEQVKDIRNDAIDEFREKVYEEITFYSGYPNCSEYDYAYEIAFSDARNICGKIAEQMKEGKHE